MLFRSRYPESSRIIGKVTNIADYGCFVEIEDGVEGLVHVSEMDWTNKNIHPSKVVQIGDEVEVEATVYKEGHDLVAVAGGDADIDAAIDHINTYGSRHSDAIVTEDYSAAMRFLDEVDTAVCYVNASTQFTDGAQFGLGAEIIDSTQKTIARGPVGLTEITTYKWIVLGDGQTRPK